MLILSQLPLLQIAQRDTINFCARNARLVVARIRSASLDMEKCIRLHIYEILHLEPCMSFRALSETDGRSGSDRKIDNLPTSFEPTSRHAPIVDS